MGLFLSVGRLPGHVVTWVESARRLSLGSTHYHPKIL